MLPLLSYQKLTNHIDAIILLNSSLTEEAAAEVLGLTTAHAIWTALETAYSNSSIKRINSLRDSLRNLSKGTSTVSDYGRQFKGICDKLAAIGQPVDEMDKLHWDVNNANKTTLEGVVALVTQMRVEDVGAGVPLTASYVGTPDWYVDSGATAHMTSSPDNVSHSAPHSGNMRVFFGNGDALPVSHIGQSMVSNKILLRDVLVIPKLTKNLCQGKTKTVVHFSRSGAPYSDAQVPESWTPPIHRPHLRSPSVGCAHSPTSDAECEPSMSFDSTPSSPYSSEDDNPPTDTKWDSNRSLNIQWMAARHNEMEALKQNCTWTLVPRPSASNIVGSKWVYRIKYHADGMVERFKARVVAQGFTQIPGLDYSHTFSPVVKASTVRIVLSLAVLSFGVLTSVRLSQNAFLMGHLNEDVYWSNHQGSLIRNFQIMYANYPRHFTV
ncbi:retrovirus-related pol polyprotein from transposon TNT 1-94 [Tanacetum coccineum]